MDLFQQPANPSEDAAGSAAPSRVNRADRAGRIGDSAGSAGYRISRNKVTEVIASPLVLSGRNTVTKFSPFVVSLSNHERPHFDKLSANG